MIELDPKRMFEETIELIDQEDTDPKIVPIKPRNPDLDLDKELDSPRQFNTFTDEQIVELLREKKVEFDKSTLEGVAFLAGIIFVVACLLALGKFIGS